MAVLLAVQPTGLLALAEEQVLPTFTVVGVAGATLRAAPDGASLALAVVPAGSIVSAVGPAAVTAGVTWRQVRTVEGQVGYLPAGLLTSTTGEDAPSVSPQQHDASMPAAPAQSVGSASVQSVGSADFAPAQSVGAAPEHAVGAWPAQLAGAPTVQPAAAAPSQVSAHTPAAPANAVTSGAASPNSARQPVLSPTPTPSPSPTPVPVRTTVERRRGQDVTITHIDTATAPDGREMGAGRIIVGFKPGASQQGRAAAHRAAGTVSTRNVGPTDMIVAQVDPSAVQQALAAYRSRADVAWAEPDRVYRTTHTPNDPEFGSQWGPIKIGLPIAWNVTTGAATTKIAILDTGIYSETSNFLPPDDPSGTLGLRGHPDLRGKVVQEQNFSNTFDVDDWYGHGTLMAGIAAARTNTTPPVGVAGVGYDVRLMNVKVLDDNGEGFDSWLASGIIWAADNGARVISMSLSAIGPCSQTLQSAVNYAWAKNVVLVAAAGNGGEDDVGDPAPESPGNCANVISVGAIDQNDARPSFSNYGPGVPLAAPGLDIYSTDNAGTYFAVSGTSPSTPHVAAVAGLLVSTAHGATSQSIATRLLQTADPIVGTGSTWGSGRINAAAAVGPASCSPRPNVTLSTSVVGSALNVVASTTGVGNVVRFIQSGAVAGEPLNALVNFPTPASDSAGTRTFVPRTVGTTATFQVQRQVAGSPTTLPFLVIDGCGAWKTFVGGGVHAGF